MATKLIANSEDESGIDPARDADKRFAIDLARAFGGAVIFSFPMLMTMELWWLGFYMNPYRLALLMFLAVPLLVGLSFYGGFEETMSVKDDLLDTFVAYAVGFAAAALMLLLFALIEPGMSLDEVIGKVAVQAVAGSIGAMFAQNLLGSGAGESENERRKRGVRYGGQLFLMAVGAVFLSMSLASTEEMVLIAYKMTEWHVVALSLVTMLMMHAFVYSVEFQGEEQSIPPDSPVWSVFLRFTVVGYAIALVISLYVLWTFGRTEGMAVEEIIKAVIVLGFPAALGASTSRLIL
ncbi:MAG: TIGR02587 family membrane protein [Pyrinomonadaceae bacterium MAG19_C2-C3]|nr:TIGR02587 family membrane protein [Pyrinomonadaceae bacterium MAG19_C2-C3]